MNQPTENAAPFTTLESFLEWAGKFVSHEISQALAEQARMTRLGRHVRTFAENYGWVEADGEGAFEFIQRHSYAVGLQDAGGNAPGTDTWGNRWPVNMLEPLVSSCPGADELPQPYEGAVTLLETLAEHGMQARQNGQPTPNSTLCMRFADELRLRALEPFRSVHPSTPAAVKAAHEVVVAAGGYRIGLVEQMLLAGSSVGEPNGSVQALERRLDDSAALGRAVGLEEAAKLYQMKGDEKSEGWEIAQTIRAMIAPAEPPKVGGPQLVSPRGDVACPYLFDSSSNYNVAIIAESGSAKSIFSSERAADRLKK